MEEALGNWEPFKDPKFSLEELIALDPFFTKFERSKMGVARLNEILNFEIPRLLHHEEESKFFSKKDHDSNFFLCFLSCMENEQEIIFDFLSAENVSVDGKYIGHYFEMGEQKQLNFDDSFVIWRDKSNSRPIKFLTNFETDAQTYLWPFLFEKFFIKLYGSYSTFLSAKPHEMIYTIFGGYYTIFDFSEAKGNQSWNQLKASELFFNEKITKSSGSSMNITSQSNLDDYQRIMIASCKKERTSFYFKIVKFEELTSEEKNFKLICLKVNENVQGYKALFGDSLPAAAKRALGASQYERHFFWLDYEDIIKQFSYISINFYKRKKATGLKRIASKMSLISYPREIWLDFEVQETEKKAVLGVHQKHKPFLHSVQVNGGKYRYSQIHFSVFNVIKESGKKQLIYLDSSQVKKKANADQFIKLNSIDPGQYLVHLQISWAHEITPNLALSVLTWKETLIPISQKYALNTFLAYSSIFNYAYLSKNPSCEYQPVEPLDSPKGKNVEHKSQGSTEQNHLVKIAKLKKMTDLLNYKEITSALMKSSPLNESEIELACLTAGMVCGLVVVTKKSLKSLYSIRFKPNIAVNMNASEKMDHLFAVMKNESDVIVLGHGNFFCLLFNRFPEYTQMPYSQLSMIESLSTISKEEAAPYPVVTESIMNYVNISFPVRVCSDLFFPHTTVMQHALANIKNATAEVSNLFTLMANTLSYRPENESFLTLLLFDPSKKSFGTMEKHIQESKKEQRTWNGSPMKLFVTFLRYPQYLVIFYENQEKYLTYFEESSFSLENLLLQDEDMVNGSLSFSVKPDHKKLLVGRVVESGKSYSYKFQSRYKFAHH